MDQRYPMPEDSTTEIQDILRRLRNLELSPRLTNASMADLSNVERVRLGLLSDESYGIQVFDENAATVFKVNGTGINTPSLPLQYRKAGDPAAAVTSGSFVNVWEAAISEVTHDAVTWNVTISADAATTGEARLIAPNVSGSPTTTALSIPASSSTAYEWDWAIPGLDIGASGVFVVLQMRRTGGAGNLYAYGPNVLYQANADRIGATASGV
jgi:hypothetical protein